MTTDEPTRTYDEEAAAMFAEDHDRPRWRRLLLLDIADETAEADIAAMSDDEVTAMLSDLMDRDVAFDLLEAREGCTRDLIDHLDTAVIVAAALADEGQPCGDCGKLVVWTEDAGWRHVETPTSCFLAHC